MGKSAKRHKKFKITFLHASRRKNISPYIGIAMKFTGIIGDIFPFQYQIKYRKLIFQLISKCIEDYRKTERHLKSIMIDVP